MEKNTHLFWFYGDPGNVNEEKRKRYITSILATSKLSDYTSVAVKLWNSLMEAVLDMPRNQGFYVMDSITHECHAVRTSEVGSIAASVLMQSAIEVYVDFAKQEEICARIEELESEIQGKYEYKDKLMKQANDINSKISELHESIRVLRVRLNRMNLGEPKCQTGDYVIAKNLYNGCKVVYRVMNTVVDDAKYIWQYKIIKLTSTNAYDYEYVHDEDIVEVIGSKPAYTQGDTVKYMDRECKVDLVRYDMEFKSWKYKLVTGDTFKNSVWAMESEIQKQ